MSATLFDRTVREGLLSGDERLNEPEVATGQRVRISSASLGSNNRTRSLTDQARGSGGQVVAKSLSDPDADATVWRLALSAGGYVSLQNTQTGRYLFRDSRGQLVTDRVAAGVRRLWRVDTSSDVAAPFAIRTSDLPAGALNVGSGDDPVVGLSGLVRESRWILEDLSESQPEPLQVFAIQSKASDAAGAALVMQEFGAESVRVREPDPREQRRQWVVRFQRNGQVLIQSVATRRDLATFNDGVLTTAEEEAGSSRLWRIRTNNAGETFAIQSLAGRNANLVDTVVGDPSGERDKVNVAFNSASDRQQWSFVDPVSG